MYFIFNSMINRIRNFVRLINGSDLQGNVFLVQARLYFAENGFVQKVKRTYHARYVRWIDNGMDNFYAMIKNYKK